MFCPNCGKEYRPGIVACPDCREVLVRERPRPSGSVEYVEYVTVLESGDSALLAVLSSMLDAAGIRCRVKSDKVQDLYGLGRLGSGFNLLAGIPKLQVEQGREEEARELLAAAERGEFSTTDEDVDSGGDDP